MNMITIGRNHRYGPHCRVWTLIIRSNMLRCGPIIITKEEEEEEPAGLFQRDRKRHPKAALLFLGLKCHRMYHSGRFLRDRRQ